MLDKWPDQDMKGGWYAKLCFPKESNIVVGKNKLSQNFSEHCSSEWYPKALGKWGSIFRVSMGWGRKTGSLVLFILLLNDILLVFYYMIFCLHEFFYSMAFHEFTLIQEASPNSFFISPVIDFIGICLEIQFYNFLPFRPQKPEYYQ